MRMTIDLDMGMPPDVLGEMLFLHTFGLQAGRFDDPKPSLKAIEPGRAHEREADVRLAAIAAEWYDADAEPSDDRKETAELIEGMTAAEIARRVSIHATDDGSLIVARWCEGDSTLAIVARDLGGYVVNRDAKKDHGWTSHPIQGA